MKKLTALILAVLFVFSLCACAKQTNEQQTEKISSPYVGKWKLESYDIQEKQAKSLRVFAHLELKDDGNFVITGHTVSGKSATYDSSTESDREYVTGVYSVDGTTINFTAQQLSDSYRLQPMKKEVDFTGKVGDDGKLNCTITNHEVIFVKE